MYAERLNIWLAPYFEMYLPLTGLCPTHHTKGLDKPALKLKRLKRQ